jgi:hypothetical protein
MFTDSWVSMEESVNMHPPAHANAKNSTAKRVRPTHLDFMSKVLLALTDTVIGR